VTWLNAVITDDQTAASDDIQPIGIVH